MATRKESKPCSRCNSKPAVSGEKYCPACRKDILAEMREAGYLTNAQPTKHVKECRGRSARSTDIIGGAAEMGTDGDDW